MPTLDLYEEGFPHGSAAGYERGCKGIACPNHGSDEILTCRDAFQQRAWDYSLRNTAHDEPIARQTPPPATRRVAPRAAPAPRPQPPQRGPGTAATSVARLAALLTEGDTGSALPPAQPDHAAVHTQPVRGPRTIDVLIPRLADEKVSVNLTDEGSLTVVRITVA